MASLRDIDLPDGLVSDIIVLAFTATIIQQTVIGAIDPITFLGIGGPFLGFYVRDKQKGADGPSINVERATVDAEVLAEPSLPESVTK